MCARRVGQLHSLLEVVDALVVLAHLLVGIGNVGQDDQSVGIQLRETVYLFESLLEVSKRRVDAPHHLDFVDTPLQLALQPQPLVIVGRLACATVQVVANLLVAVHERVGVHGGVVVLGGQHHVAVVVGAVLLVGFHLFQNLPCLLDVASAQCLLAVVEVLRIETIGSVVLGAQREERGALLARCCPSGNKNDGNQF